MSFPGSTVPASNAFHVSMSTQSEFSYEEFYAAEQALINGEASDIDFGEIASRCS